MDLTLIELLYDEDAPEVSGYADAQIQFSGPIDAPSFSGSVDIPGLVAYGWGPVGLHSRFRYEYGALLAKLRMDDDDGELLETEGSLLVDLVNLVLNPSETLEALATSPWRLSLASPTTSVERIPGRDRRGPRPRCRPPPDRRKLVDRRRRLPYPWRSPRQLRLALRILPGAVRKRLIPASHASGQPPRRGDGDQAGGCRRQREGGRRRCCRRDADRGVDANGKSARPACHPDQRGLLRSSVGEHSVPLSLHGRHGRGEAPRHGSIRRRPAPLVHPRLRRPSSASPRARQALGLIGHDHRDTADHQPNPRQLSGWGRRARRENGVVERRIHEHRGEASPDLG